MSGNIEITSGSESDLQSALANVGPVSVAVDGSNNAFRVSIHYIETQYLNVHVLLYSIIRVECTARHDVIVTAQS